MITAKEARLKSLPNKPDPIKETLQAIERDIVLATKRGRFYINCYKPNLALKTERQFNQLTKEIEELGFRVIDQEMNTLKIEW